MVRDTHARQTLVGSFLSNPHQAHTSKLFKVLCERGRPYRCRLASCRDLAGPVSSFIHKEG